MKNWIITLGIFMIFSHFTMGQEGSKNEAKYIITLKNNRVYEGFILSDDGKQMMLF